MTEINKKYPQNCSYFEPKFFLSTLEFKRNGRAVEEFYHKCTLSEGLMCKRQVKLSMPIFDVENVCVVKKRE